MGEKASVKVSGGKLVQIEAEHGESFTDVSITGDFFIEPPEALEDIEDAITGLSTEAPDEKIIEAVEAVDAELIGFSPNHILKALREVTE